MQTQTLGWVAAAALLVGAVVRLLKTDTLTIALANLGLPPVPKRILPWLSLALGIASAILDVRLQDTDWPTAIAKGLVAGVVAIAGHELGVESARKGKELLGVLLVFGIGMAISACGARVDDPTAHESAVIVQLAHGVELADQACATIVLAKKDAALGHDCAKARDAAKLSLEAAEDALDSNDAARAADGRCAFASALNSAQHIADLITSAGGKIPPALSRAFTLAPMLRGGCT